jgi:chaperone required for assembly of F1-ATPase
MDLKMRDTSDEEMGQSPRDPNAAVQQSSRAPQRNRFYSSAGVEPASDGFAVLLDGRGVRTPAKRPLVAPVAAIADAIAAEWNAQSTVIEPQSMPLTRLANSVVDGVTDRHQEVADDIVNYLGSDALFYRADHPEALVARQAAQWDPLLFWAAEQLGAHFILAQGILHVRQPDQALAAARAALPSDPWRLGALHSVTTITGSALLALALMQGRLTADEVWAAAHVDEDWNIEQWGADDEATSRRAARHRDFNAAALVLTALA